MNQGFRRAAVGIPGFCAFLNLYAPQSPCGDTTPVLRCVPYQPRSIRCAAVPPVSAIVITKNEADAIADALTSLSWADEIIVVDAESTDSTVAIARQFTERVYVRAWKGYVDQKNHAAGLATHDWIFSLDADERHRRAQYRTSRTAPARTPCLCYLMPVCLSTRTWMRTTDMYPTTSCALRATPCALG